MLSGTDGNGGEVSTGGTGRMGSGSLPPRCSGNWRVFSDEARRSEVLLQELNRLLADTYCMEHQPSSVTADLGGEDAELARAAIKYLMFHDLPFSWKFPDDPPSEDIQRLLVSYLDGIEGEIGELVSRYLTQSVAPHLGLGRIEVG
jgi:hypothetical protein